ncbi:MAG: glycosyltransferase family 4 protein [Thermodesulfobacteriota bacterium]|nr:glycosyltransferase family 4 protein [Thermodesulfobacteriota bacterium]
MRPIILIGPLPPPYVGQSIAFQMLVEGIRKHHLPYAVVDLSGKRKSYGGAASWARALEYIKILFDYFYKSILGKKTIYITIAQSRHGFLRDFVIIWLAYLKGHRIVCHLKGGNYDNFYEAQPKWLRWLIRKTLLRTDSLLVLGQRLRDMYNFEPKLKNRIQVVPNGLPFHLNKLEMPKTLPENKSEPIRLLYLSNLIESKGYLDLLEAVRILVKEYEISIECRFCGLFLANKPDDVLVHDAVHGQKLFEDFVTTNNLEKNVTYCGVVSGEEKNNELRNAHFFVLPTNYDNEGQPVSIIEAMAFGNVVISTDYRAIPDMVVHGKTGFLVPYGQPKVIARVIADSIGDHEMYRKMSKAALEHFQKHFTREAHLSRIIPILQKDD